MSIAPNRLLTEEASTTMSADVVAVPPQDWADLKVAACGVSGRVIAAGGTLAMFSA